MTNELFNKCVAIGATETVRKGAVVHPRPGIAISQAVMFLRLRHQNVQIFHSPNEMVLVAALAVVMLLGIFVKSRQNLRK
jgi:hypothetical protein